MTYSDRLLAEGIYVLTGRGASCDNATAEDLNKSYKHELVWPQSWKIRDDLEAATAKWIDWYNHTRSRHNNDSDCSPANTGMRYYDQPHAATPTVAWLHVLHISQDDRWHLI